MANVTDDERLKLVHSAVGADFGLTIDQVVSHADDFGRFQAWLGGDHAKIKAVLEAVQSEGMSPAWFAAYEYNEGYNSSWGWLNYTRPHGDPVSDAHFVAAHMVSLSKNMSTQPSWIDAGNPVDFVPASVKASGNADFNAMPSGTIGRAYIPSTAAATWATYYPLGLQAAYNGVQNYADAIAATVTTIKFWGGVIDGNTNTNGNNGGGDTGGNAPKPEDYVTDALELFKRAIKEILTKDVYDNHTQQFYFNKFVKMVKQYDNMYKLRPNFDIDNLTIASINNFFGGKKPTPEPDPGPGPTPSGGWQLPFNAPLAPYEEGQQFGNTGYWRGTWFHDGYDFGSAHYGGDILAVTDATVKYVGMMGASLRSVIVLNNGTYDIMYQEFADNLATVVVSVGQKVKKGEKIAALASYHLHVGITKMDFNQALAHWNVNDGTWIDPIPILTGKA